MQFVALT